MINQALCTSFKYEILLGVHDLTHDAIYMAMYSNNATLGYSTTVYSQDGEVTGTGYTAGGKVLTNVTVNTDGYTAYVSFDNPTWSSATFTARGALLYNASKGNRTIAVIDFGADKTASGSFTVQLPTNTANSAIIRISI